MTMVHLRTLAAYWFKLQRSKSLSIIVFSSSIQYCHEFAMNLPLKAVLGEVGRTQLQVVQHLGRLGADRSITIYRQKQLTMKSM
jgi:hypothetical protein